MRVRIVKCTSKGYWYADRIGDEFDVIDPLNGEDYEVVGEDRYILKEDFKVLLTAVPNPTYPIDMCILKNPASCTARIGVYEPAKMEWSGEERKPLYYICSRRVHILGARDLPRPSEMDACVYRVEGKLV